MHPLQKQLRAKVREVYPVKKKDERGISTLQLAEAYRKLILGYNENWIIASSENNLESYRACNNAEIFTGLEFQTVLSILPEIEANGKRANCEGTSWAQAITIPPNTNFLPNCSLRIGELERNYCESNIYNNIFGSFLTKAVIPTGSLDFNSGLLQKILSNSLAKRKPFLSGGFYNPHLKHSNWHGAGKTFCIVYIP